MLSNVGADLLAIRGVEPDYLSVSVILFLLFFSLEELLDNLSSIECGRCFIIWGGWFEEVWIYSKLSFGFLWGLYVLFARLNVASKNFGPDTYSVEHSFQDIIWKK